MPIKLISGNGTVRLSLKVVPCASRDRVMGELGDALKVAVSKPPEGGAANKAVVKLLAATLGDAESNVEIVRGHASPRKKVAITGISLEDVRTKLNLLERSS
jgi:uncharacterized protein